MPENKQDKPVAKLGDKVTILECHSMPDLVGKAGRVIGEFLPEYQKHPLLVELAEAIKLELPIGEVQFKGPFPFRAEELEVIHSIEVPDIFKQAFGDKP